MKNSPITVILPNMTPAAASVVGLQTITADLPAAWDFWEFSMLISNLGTAVIEEVRLMVNQKPIIRIPGVDLDGINVFDRATAFATNSILKIFMRRLGIKGGASVFAKLGKDAAGTIAVVTNGNSAKDLGVETSLNCGSPDINGVMINSLRMEMDLSNTDVVPPSVQIRALATDPVGGGTGTVRRLEKITVPIVTGPNILTGRSLIFADSIRMILNRIIFVPDAGNTLDNFKVRFNNKETLVRSSVENDEYLSQDLVRDPATLFGTYNGYALDWTERGYGDEGLLIGPVGTDLQIEFDVTGPGGNLLIYEDSVGALG